jgi:nucleoside-diphosphate-sugar epimerase
MRVFITGGAGWVGSEVIRQLVKGGHDVTALVRSVPGVEKVTNSGARALEGQSHGHWDTARRR